MSPEHAQLVGRVRSSAAALAAAVRTVPAGKETQTPAPGEWSVRETLVHARNVVVLVLDATEPIVEQDQEIARYTAERGRALVVAVSKWDLAGGSPEPHRAMLDRVKAGLRFVGYAPIVVTSAPQGWGIAELLGEILQAADAHARRVPTGKLNRVIEQAEQSHLPPADRFGRQGKIYYATQPRAQPPTIVLFVNDPALFPDEYERYLVGRLRRAFDFMGTPVRLLFRPRERGREAAPS